MRIGNSAVTMTSNRSYASVEYTQSMSLMNTKEQLITPDKTSDKTIMEQMQEMTEEMELQQAKAEQEAKELEAKNAATMLKRTTLNNQQIPTVSSLYELKIKLLEQMINMLKKARGEKVSDKTNDFIEHYNASLNSPGFGFALSKNPGNVVSNSGVYVMQHVQSSFRAEYENTAFTTTGMVTTDDGRQINFDVSFEMSRSFQQSMESYSMQTIQFCDPLVVNFDGDVAELGDQKFLFDLDADGETEEVSGFTSNSGFLALDRNNDGKINDGRELFGTESGNGFKDLAAYDKDGNGWIDEDDEVFSRLKIWTKDSNGNDKLISIKEAGLGAIYLGSAETQFSLNSAVDNSTNGMIRNSGIYLNEDGSAGTIQHVDFAV